MKTNACDDNRADEFATDFSGTRRGFLKAMGFGALALAQSRPTNAEEEKSKRGGIDRDFLIKSSELTLKFKQPPGARRLSFHNHVGSADVWRENCREKLAELMGISIPKAGRVTELRSTEYIGVRIHALVMEVPHGLTIPAYLLVPKATRNNKRAVMAIHGHGEVEPCVGLRDDYHHSFALRLAKEGHIVLCPEHRGFGTLVNLAAGIPGMRLDYWEWKQHSQFTLVTDAFLYGKTLIGETVDDLLRWEDWLCQTHNIDEVDVAGISYGGDLTFTYPPFSKRAGKLFVSGSFGSFSVIYPLCYNAPAHCIPNVLNWMDRSDIAGLNAPRPILLHYGELDTPGPKNHSAAYNRTVEPAVKELREIYKAFGAEGSVGLKVTAGSRHEMDNDILLEFLDS